MAAIPKVASCAQAEMEGLATSVRKVARLLWALHLSFMDGFDEVRLMSARGVRVWHAVQAAGLFVTLSETCDPQNMTALPWHAAHAMVRSSRARKPWPACLRYCRLADAPVAQNMIGLLKQHYPSQLMPQLAAHCQATLDAAAAAFPSRRHVDAGPLQSFVTAVEVICLERVRICGASPREPCFRLSSRAQPLELLFQ